MSLSLSFSTSPRRRPQQYSNVKAMRRMRATDYVSCNPRSTWLGGWGRPELLGSVLGWRESLPDVNHYLLTVVVMNISLLVFNLLPVYPLDGGQILQALLWFVVGQARSLMIVSVIGIIAGGGLVLLALAVRGFWLGLIAAFVVLRAISGFQQARILQRLAQMPRHEDLVCPFCGRSPIKGDFWTCHICHQRFDTFEHRAVCPNCSERFPVTACPECGQRHPFEQWFPARRADTCSG